jgi:glucokinase
VAEAAQQGDPVALEIFETVALHLGEGLAILVDILDPDKIVIGSIFARCQELLLPIASSVLQREIVQAKGRNVAIVPAALGDQVGDYACLALAAKVREDT